VFSDVLSRVLRKRLLTDLVRRSSGQQPLRERLWRSEISRPDKEGIHKDVPEILQCTQLNLLWFKHMEATDQIKSLGFKIVPDPTGIIICWQMRIRAFRRLRNQLNELANIANSQDCSRRVYRLSRLIHELAGRDNNPSLAAGGPSASVGLRPSMIAKCT
jgi:hypothetical protein